MTIDVLKVATADHHARAENSPAMQMLMSERLCTNVYGEILEAIYRFVGPLEASLMTDAPEVSARFSYSDRVKCPSLTQDLAFVNRDLPSMNGTPGNHVDGLERPERAVGAMYVVEGATLGGKFVSAHVSRVLGFKAPLGVSYFHSYGERRGSMWNAFKGEANRLTSEAGWDHVEMIDAAIETFERYTEAMHGA